MKEVLSDARVDAAVACYERADRARPGSEAAVAAEHAVLLTLSAERPEKDAKLLFGDAMRDAVRTITRATDGRAIVENQLARLSHDGIRTGGAGPVADVTTPDQAVLARELIDVLRRRAARLGAPAPRVLAGLLVGETESETADAARVSRSTVTRLRQRLRDCAADAGYAPAAA